MSSQQNASRGNSGWLLRLGDISGWLAGGITLIMMVAILREVVGRYFFNAPSDWSLELCEDLMVALTYLGAPYTELCEGNIRVEFLYNRFSPPLKMCADILISLIGMGWAGVLTWQGWILAWESWKIGARSEGAMAWPLFSSQVLVPIGSFLLFVVLARKLVLRLRDLIGRKSH
jgi:TRAP-type C4-dicarboxylate transport system permease small subunit